MPDLSVIIPIYNIPVEKLERCFSSILSLDKLSFEALLIDDGSHAPIGAFCKNFAEKHPDFHYFYQENQGVSVARNLGLTQARGRYITFVDADDCILGQTLSQQLPNGDGPDLVIFDMLLDQHSNQTLWPAFDRPGGVLSRENVLYQLITNASISGPCAKLYKTDCIRRANLRFNPLFVAGEDWMFVCDFVMEADTYLYQAEPVYRYFREEATGQSRMTRFPDKTLHNQFQRYARKQELISSTQWTIYSAPQVSSLAAIELIENLFNSAADLLLAKQYTRQRKNQIRTAVAEAGRLLTGHPPKKTLLKLWVLTQCPAVLSFLAHLRALYLKVK